MPVEAHVNDIQWQQIKSGKFGVEIEFVYSYDIS